MALYEVGTRVWVKPFKCLGEITKADYKTFNGKAHYVVRLDEPKNLPEAAAYGRMEVYRDYNMLSADLRRADKCCDDCGKWLPASSFNGGQQARNPWDHVVEAEFCFLCVRKMREEPYEYPLG